MIPTARSGFDGLRVAAFESRMAGPMADLIAKQGGVAVEAPALREIALGDQTEALAFAGRLVAGEFDVVVFLTGVGTRFLAQAIDAKFAREEWREALGRA
jgi:uroporphyrinogen-III synthase